MWPEYLHVNPDIAVDALLHTTALTHSKTSWDNVMLVGVVDACPVAPPPPPYSPRSLHPVPMHACIFIFHFLIQLYAAKAPGRG